MRPLSLDVKGFTCFRDAQPTLDLQPLTLFAIAGPTGAGKSSLLDAMTFALYGKVPRMGKGSVKDLISHGRDRMTVTLRFAVGDATYLVTRTVRRGTAAGGCQLDVVIGTGTRQIASGAKEVTTAVERLVGLDYDAFTHAVLLPQGEFARFLKGDSATRRRILQELLRLTVYGRMQKLAGERSRDARSQLGAFEQQLERYADATPDAIALAEAELADVQAQHASLIGVRDQARARRAELETLAKVARELAARRLELSKLQAAAEEQSARLARLERSRRARQVRATVDQLARDQALWQTRVQEQATATARLVAARESSDAAAQRLSRATQALKDLEPRSTRIEALRRLEGRLTHLDAVLAECRTLAARAKAIEADAEARRADLSARERQLSEATADVTRKEHALEAVRFDAQELQLCEDGRDLARELTRDRAEAPAADVRIRDAKRAVAEHERTVADEAVRLEEARAALQRAEVRRQDAVRALTEAQDAHRAMTLRSHLQPGHTCPVCEQHVAVVPAVTLPPELAVLFTAQDEAVDACRTLEVKVTKQQETHLRAVAALDGVRSQLEAAQQARKDLLARIKASVTRLHTALGRYLPASAATMPEHWLLERLEALRSQRTEFEARERALVIARATRADAEHQVAIVRQALETCRRDADDVSARLTSKAEERDALHAEIRAVSTAEDPRAELAALMRQVQDAQGELDAARVASMQLETAVAAAAEAEAIAIRLTEEARASLDARALAVDQALHACGFASADEARTAFLTDVEQSDLESRAEDYSRRFAAVSALVADLDAQAAGRQVSDVDLASALERERAADDAVNDGVRRAGQLEVRIATLREQCLQAATVRSQVESTRHSFEIHQRLATDLQANAFQAWLLREAFERLVAGASARLMDLSGRYTLMWHDDEFAVVDHDHAQERRPADTLSGGEAFLASLALALELSEQVQRAAGAVRLDSLFIDEGFGSLDAAALDTVANAIETLQLGGRMVGIITHIRELTDRMPTCIVIDKGPDGSRWSVTA